MIGSLYSDIIQFVVYELTMQIPGDPKVNYAYKVPLLGQTQLIERVTLL